MSWLRRHRVSLLVLLGMAAIWQILSMTFTAEAVPGEPMVPGWQIVFGRTLLSLADYWQGGLGVIEGAAESVSSLLKLWSGGRSDQVGRRKGFVLFGYALAVLTRPQGRGLEPGLQRDPAVHVPRACERRGGERDGRAEREEEERERLRHSEGSSGGGAAPPGPRDLMSEVPGGAPKPGVGR